MWLFLWLIFFFKQKTAYEMRISDWSSDVCSSDLRRSKQERSKCCRRPLPHRRGLFLRFSRGLKIRGASLAPAARGDHGTVGQERPSQPSRFASPAPAFRQTWPGSCVRSPYQTVARGASHSTQPTGLSPERNED